jgi:putative DNA primase/helicase
MKVKGSMKMADLVSYEEFERQFKETEQELTPIEQARRDCILKILNQKASEVGKYKKSAVPRELALLDLHMEEIMIIHNLSHEGFIEGKPTNEVHKEFLRICNEKGINNPMEQIAFSQFIIKYFGYSIKDKKIKGKKYRIFVNETLDWWKR